MLPREFAQASSLDAMYAFFVPHRESWQEIAQS